MGKMLLTSCRALSTPGKFSNVDRYVWVPNTMGIPSLPNLHNAEAPAEGRQTAEYLRSYDQIAAKDNTVECPAVRPCTEVCRKPGAEMSIELS